MAEHQGQTDQFELTSVINDVLWGSPQAPAGFKVSLDIFTHYVGNGSGVKIEVKENYGKKHGNYSDKIHGNHFWPNIKCSRKRERCALCYR